MGLTVSNRYRNLKNENGNIIRSGIPLLVGVDLLAHYQDSKLPTGPLFMMNPKEETVEATRDNLGEGVLLLYGNTT